MASLTGPLAGPCCCHLLGALPPAVQQHNSRWTKRFTGLASTDDASVTHVALCDTATAAHPLAVQQTNFSCCVCTWSTRWRAQVLNAGCCCASGDCIAVLTHAVLTHATHADNPCCCKELKPAAANLSLGSALGNAKPGGSCVY